MSAAVVLSQEGYRVTLLEKRSALGGRAGSLLDAATGEWVDNCQHVLMPCCTNLLDFYRRIGAQDKIRFYSEIPFIDQRGRLSILRSSVLPAPLHCAPSFLGLKFLKTSDKLRIARGLVSLVLQGRKPAAADSIALDWFLRHGQNSRTIQNFWELILVSALNETLDRSSLRYVSKVFLDAFLSHPRGWWLGIPTVALSSLYGESLMRLLESRKGQVLLRTEAQKVVLGNGEVRHIALGNGERLEVDSAVVAVPWHAAARVLPENAFPEGVELLHPGLSPSPITGIHLWFDRVVTSLDFAALPGRQVQWFFNKTRTFQRSAEIGSYLQLVTSASRAWMDLNKNQILEIALRELAEVLPVTRGARVSKSHVLKEPMATFSPMPGSDSLRPGATTRIPNLFLAGDWIQTGWPATMEGAVRGGYLAAEALLKADGHPKKLLVPDLAPSGLARLMFHRARR